MASENGQARTVRVYDRLRDLIVEGRLAPGSRIVESEVAQRLGVSRTPIRASLRRLLQEGYLQDDGEGQQWRPVVAPLTRGDAEELLTITGQLEGLAAYLAAGLPGPGHGPLVRRLHSLTSELGALAEGGDPLRYYPLDAAFHRAYVEAAAGPRLRALHSSIEPQVERYGRVYTLALPDKVETSYREHAVIARAIEARDAPAAQAAVEANWRGAAHRLGAVIDRIGERGSW